MERKIYVYQNPLDNELAKLFESINDDIIIESKKTNVLILKDQDYYNPEPVDFEAYAALIEEDFEGTITMFIEPYSDDVFPFDEELIELIKEVPKKVYFFEDIITYAVIKEKVHLKEKIKDYIAGKVSSDVIYTVRKFIEHNLNSSQSAKKLYMHRNTLNYRVDNFIENVHINVKTFKGASAIYLLYEY